MMEHDRAPSLAAGIDVGATKTLAVVVTRQGDIVRQVRVNSDFGSARDHVGERLTSLVASLVISPAELAGIGLGAPAIVDPSTGQILSSPNLRVLEGLSADKLFGGDMGKVPILIDNDVNLAALGESWLGAARGARHFVFIAVGTGIGTGLVLDGRLYHGTGGAGEGGHMVLVPDGPECGCGSRGCLEAMASGSAIARRYREVSGQTASVSDIFSLSAAGEPEARQVIEEAAAFLGIGVANFINILAPEMVVLGGGVMMNQHAVLMPLVEAAMQRHARKPLLARTAVVVSKLGEMASAVGAAALAWQR